MWTNLRQVTPPATTIFDVDFAKQHSNVFTGDDDDYITYLIGAATSFVEGPNGIGCALLTQGWQATFPALYSSTGMTIPLGPIQSIDSITYVDMSGATQTLSPAVYDYSIGGLATTVITQAYNANFPATQPRQVAVTVNFTAGFGATSASVPFAIQQAILMLVSYWYTQRDAVAGIANRDSPTDIPYGVGTLLDNFRSAAFA